MGTEQGYFSTPLGWLRISSFDGAVVAVDFLSGPAAAAAPSEPCLIQAQAWLEAYFARSPLPALPPLAPAGTPFQQRVWRLLADIPPGQTRTYGELANLLGTAPRAVGGALRANPIPILIPCHRIIAAQGLGGYAGASEEGRWRKAWLLAHEGLENRL